MMKQGYFVRGRLFQYEETPPSVDQDYWLCVKPDGRPRCLFAPIAGS